MFSGGPQTDDPGAWTGMIPLRPAKKAVYEYSCIEGNYGLESILADAGREDKASSRWVEC
jgi:hypothetical protein